MPERFLNQSGPTREAAAERAKETPTTKVTKLAAAKQKTKKKKTADKTAVERATAGRAVLAKAEQAAPFKEGELVKIKATPGTTPHPEAVRARASPQFRTLVALGRAAYSRRTAWREKDCAPRRACRVLTWALISTTGEVLRHVLRPRRLHGRGVLWYQLDAAVGALAAPACWTPRRPLTHFRSTPRLLYRCADRGVPRGTASVAASTVKHSVRLVDTVAFPAVCISWPAGAT